MLDDDAIVKMECTLRTVARRVQVTAEVLDLCRFVEETGQTMAAWAAVLDRQAEELERVATILRQDSWNE